MNEDALYDGKQPELTPQILPIQVETSLSVTNGHNQPTVMIDGKVRFPCSFANCNKTFSAPHNKLRHEKLHLVRLHSCSSNMPLTIQGIKPFICPMCHKAFQRQSDCKVRIGFSSESLSKSYRSILGPILVNDLMPVVMTAAEEHLRAQATSSDTKDRTPNLSTANFVIKISAGSGSWRYIKQENTMFLLRKVRLAVELFVMTLQNKPLERSKSLTHHRSQFLVLQCHVGGRGGGGVNMFQLGIICSFSENNPVFFLFFFPCLQGAFFSYFHSHAVWVQFRWKLILFITIIVRSSSLFGFILDCWNDTSSKFVYIRTVHSNNSLQHVYHK